MWFQKKKKDPAEMSRDLRAQALSMQATTLGLQPTDSRVWGALMETGYPQAVASLVAFADGTTSLYFSSGGGMIGAGTHETVRKASNLFLRLANEHIAKFAPTSDSPLPGKGRVRFYVHTFDGLLTAERDEQDLGHQRDPLWPVFHAGHAVIAAIRELSPA